MNLLQRTFRRWWQVPRRSSDAIEHRTVSFLELFYDLVYVMLIAEVAHTLAEHVDGAGLLHFVFLFVMVWWAWLNGTLYHDLHGNNDVRTRIFTFLQMITVAAMTVFAHDALGESSVGFALSYAAFLAVLGYLWWRTGVYDHLHKPLSTPYVRGFLVAFALFIVSVFVAAPLRFYLWGAALIMSLLLPFISSWRQELTEEETDAMEQSFTMSASGKERFGLFTIIVLGEVIVGVIRGVQQVDQIDWTIGITALLGMMVAIGIWWVYFDFLSQQNPRGGRNSTIIWAYLHLALTMSIAAVGAAIRNVGEHAGDHLPDDVRWLLVGAVAMAFITIALLMRNLDNQNRYWHIYQVGSNIVMAAGFAVALLGLTNLDTIPLLGALVAVILVPVASGLWMYMKVLDSAGAARVG